MLSQEMEDDMDMDMEDEGPIKVVKNYKRTTAGPRTALTASGEAYDPALFAVSPITGELVAHADMAEHMRISLLDPRRVSRQH
jgi:splicing factor 3A subunit 1